MNQSQKDVARSLLTRTPKNLPNTGAIPTRKLARKQASEAAGMLQHNYNLIVVNLMPDRIAAKWRVSLLTGVVILNQASNRELVVFAHGYNGGWRMALSGGAQ